MTQEPRWVTWLYRVIMGATLPWVGLVLFTPPTGVYRLAVIVLSVLLLPLVLVAGVRAMYELYLAFRYRD